MKKDTLVQFVCFITDLKQDDFVSKWERYAKKLKSNAATNILREAETKSKFRYMSQHEAADGDFQFSFMKERRSEHFPEHNVKVIQAGGYMPLQEEEKYNEDSDGTRLMVFISHDENEIDFYRQVPLYRSLNIYQAYYENCMYSYILQYTLPENGVADDLFQLIKSRPGAEIVQYKECLVPQL